LFQAYVTFHSYGQAILYPWGYDKKAPQAPDTKDLLRVGRKMVTNIKKFGGGGSYIVGNSAKAYYPAAGKIDYFTKRGYLAKNS
jgi:carboxypeptidase A4